MLLAQELSKEIIEMLMRKKQSCSLKMGPAISDEDGYLFTSADMDKIMFYLLGDMF